MSTPKHEETRPHRDAHHQIADFIESDAGQSDRANPVTPHPTLMGFPEWEGQSADHQPATPGKLPRDIIEKCAHQPQNDTGNGQRLLAWFGGDVLHVRDVGWQVWAGTHWSHEGGQELVTRFAQSTAERIALESGYMAATPTEQSLIKAARDACSAIDALERSDADPAAKKRQQQKLLRLLQAGENAKAALNARQVGRCKYSITSGNAGKIKGMIDQALPHRSIKIDQLDADKLAFNVDNGTLHFVCDEVPDPNGSDHGEAMIKRWRVELRSHDRAGNITKLAPVVFDPKATCPQFAELIERFQPNESVRNFLQRYHGYALTGLTGEQCLVFNYGTGSNWKSTFIEMMARIMGDYCVTIAFESLAGDTQKSGSQASPDIARLPGARLVRASEPERGVQFRESLIKSLTGGEPMLTRHNFKDFFEFRPDFKLVLSGNHKPEIGGVDHGIWRRIRFVPWPVTIHDSQKRAMDDVLRELWAERSGILNWLIAGSLDYLNSGLQTPQEVIEATAAYREEMDPVGSFVTDCVDTVPPHPDGSPASVVSARDMFDAFGAWGYANSVRPWKEKGFATAMSQKGFTKERRNNGRVYLHVKLKNVPKGRPRSSDPSGPPADDEVVPV